MSKTTTGYLQKFLAHLRGSIFWSSLLTLIFFVIYMPALSGDQYWLSFKICMGYSGSVFFYVTLVYGIYYFLLAQYKKRFHREASASYWLHFAISALASILGIVQGAYIKAYMLGYKPRYEEIVFSAMMGCFIALVFIFRALYRDAKGRNAELKSANTEAELHALKNQMQPHFLFNSLNSLLSLIETNSHEAPVVTQKLSDLYREILVNSNKNVATLRSEVAIIDKYLSMEKLRFGERLSYRIQSPENSENIYVPPLILQTLVENAVKHGVSNSIKASEIAVTIKHEGLGYEASVCNPGILASTFYSTGTGIKNSKSRLELLYGEKARFSIEQREQDVLARFWFSGENVS